MGRGLDYIHKMRGLTFVKVGMRIKAEDRQGVIQGENSSGNLSVLFDGDKKPRSSTRSTARGVAITATSAGAGLRRRPWKMA